MENEDDYPSSITSNYLRKQLDSCQKISKNGYDNSSVLKCLQDKVNELRAYKEKYFEMEAQLKSANDAIKFQEAEYSFRDSELQGEIKHLKQIEMNLRAQISKSEIEKSKNAHLYDVQVSLQIENQKLNQEIENKDRKIDSLSTEIQNQKSKIGSLIAEIESLNKMVLSLKSELNDKSKQLQREKEKVKTVAQRFNILHEKYENEKNQNQELHKNKNLNSISIQKLNDKLKQAQKVSNDQKSIFEHIESERRKIYDLLGIDYEDVNGNWSKLFETCSSILNANEHLKRKIDSMDDGQLKINNQRFDNENKMLRNQIAKMKLKNHFTNLIDRQNSSFSKQLNELHESVFETDNTNMRSIFLSVIFAQRLLRVFRAPSVIDLSALKVFKGRESYSPEIKLRDLRNKFVQLTQDLLVSKQDWIDSENKIKSLKLELKQANRNIKKSEDGNDNYSKQILLLKNRVLELQQELSTLISPDQYEKLCEELETYKSKHEMNNTIKISDPAYQKVLIEENQQLKDTINEYEKEIESLNLLLKEKTKEILALERINNRHKNLEKTSKSSFACLSVENRILNDEFVNPSTRISEPEPVTMFSQRNYGLFCKINPAFLGS